MRRTILALLAMVLALFTMTGTSAVADGGDDGEAQRPFTGTLDGSVTFAPADPAMNCTWPPAPEGPLMTISQGVGTATHMGRVTMSSVHCSGDFLDGSMVLTAANGDQVFLDYSGPCTPFPPPTPDITCDLAAEVTGGTGRFEGATGEADLTAHVIYPGTPGPGPWEAHFAWEGWISY